MASAWMEAAAVQNLLLLKTPAGLPVSSVKKWCWLYARVTSAKLRDLGEAS